MITILLQCKGNEMRTNLIKESQKAFTPDEMKAFVDTLTREELAYLWRFSPVGSTFWQNNEYAVERFMTLGGFSPEISKRIGWGEE
jgi:hypothetical protein